MSQKGWCTIESDPGVFTELIQKIGVQGVQVADLYSLDLSTLQNLEPIYGLVFLFKWVGTAKSPHKPLPYVPADLFFARQMISNACATQAILSVLMNIEMEKDSPYKVVLGDQLDNLKDFSDGLDPGQIGDTIGELSKIRESHNSFARPEPFVMEKVKATDDDDVFHFISYAWFRGKVYELDGLKSGPIEICVCEKSKWLEETSNEIKKRISLYKSNEIKFHLMGIIHDRAEVLKYQISEVDKELEKLGDGKDEAERQQVGELSLKHLTLRQLMSDDAERKEKWRKENERRRHNYIQLMVEMMKLLAKKKVLVKLVDEAKKREEMRKEVEKMEKMEKKEEPVKKDEDGDVVMKDK